MQTKDLSEIRKNINQLTKQKFCLEALAIKPEDKQMLNAVYDVLINKYQELNKQTNYNTFTTRL